jgi:uncharacterized membrane-anchored protein
MNYSTIAAKDRPITRRRLIGTVAAVLFAFAGALSAAGDATPQKIELKDGSTLVIQKNGTMYHADAAGNRMRMRDGVVMEGKDGTRYMMKNDAVWRQITEKGTMSAH